MEIVPIVTRNKGGRPRKLPEDRLIKQTTWLLPAEVAALRE